MKKIFPVMLAAALGLSLLSGCASSGTDAASSAAETTAAETEQQNGRPGNHFGIIFGGNRRRGSGQR